MYFLTKYSLNTAHLLILLYMTKKETYNLIPLMNAEANILHKIIAKKIQQCLKLCIINKSDSSQGCKDGLTYVSQLT